MSTEDVDVSTQAGFLAPRAEPRSMPGIGSASDAAPAWKTSPSPSAAATRVELDLVIAAAVSDQGLVHHRNEDSFYLEVAGERDVDRGRVRWDLVRQRRQRRGPGRRQGRGRRSSREAVWPTPTGTRAGDRRRDPGCRRSRDSGRVDDAGQGASTRRARSSPRCAAGGDITVGWVGDSRAYWFDRRRRAQLTVDDSFAEEGIAKGLLTPEQAAKSPFLHSITHWVGPDAPERPPRTVSLRPDRPGRLVLCTDGLWNYAPSADELARLIDALPDGAAPAAVARALADTAN